MLYGMDEFNYNEYGLIKKAKLNIKRVIIVIALLLACFGMSFLGFMMTYDDSPNKENVGIADDKNDASISSNEVKETNKEDGGLILSNGKIDNLSETNNDELPLHDEEQTKTRIVPQPNENAKEEIKAIYGSEEKQVYLTFDDGPSKDVTPQILEILKENDVKATFFVLGARVDLYPDTLRREYEEGHYIANHGYSHKYSKIYENKDTTFQEYIECENSIKRALNNDEYNSYLFRFPGGSNGGKYSSVKAESRELFDSYGIAYTNWNCLTGDAENKKTKEACIKEMLNTKGNQNSIILLMHDANDKSQTVEALPEIIQYYKNEGYTFKTFYEIF